MAARSMRQRPGRSKGHARRAGASGGGRAGGRATSRRDIRLVVHREMQQNAHVRAVLPFLDELMQRERPLMGRAS